MHVSIVTPADKVSEENWEYFQKLVDDKTSTKLVVHKKIWVTQGTLENCCSGSNLTYGINVMVAAPTTKMFVQWRSDAPDETLGKEPPNPAYSVLPQYYSHVSIGALSPWWLQQLLAVIPLLPRAVDAERFMNQALTTLREQVQSYVVNGIVLEVSDAKKRKTAPTSIDASAKRIKPNSCVFKLRVP